MKRVLWVDLTVRHAIDQWPLFAHSGRPTADVEKALADSPRRARAAPFRNGAYTINLLMRSGSRSVTEFFVEGRMQWLEYLFRKE